MIGDELLRGLLAGDAKNRRACALLDDGRSFKEQIKLFQVRVPTEQQNDGVLVLEAECCARLASLLRVVHEPIDGNPLRTRWTLSVRLLPRQDIGINIVRYRDEPIVDIGSIFRILRMSLTACAGDAHSECRWTTVLNLRRSKISRQATRP